MHVLMIILALTIAWGLRFFWQPGRGTWQQRFSSSLFGLLFPGILIFATAIALICMGWQGQMGGWQTGCFGYIVAAIAICGSIFMLVKLAYQGWQYNLWVQNCQRQEIDGYRVGILDSDGLFAGQIGFWQPQLILSQGLITTLSLEQLDSVLAHEQGHLYYRDTFWFFWLGWVRACTCWLPNTEAIWQELLILRELRADAFAATRVDPLLLAESLLVVVGGSILSNDVFCAALGTSPQCDRLEQRINALLESPVEIANINFAAWHKFSLALLPLIAVIFHQ